MIEKYKFVTNLLKAVTPNVYPESAYDKTTFPYVVYNFPSSSPLEKHKDGIIFEVDIWDYDKEGYDVISEIEILTSQIDDVFKDCRHSMDGNFLLFQKIGRFPIPDEEKRIKRRQLRYLIKSYE